MHLCIFISFGIYNCLSDNLFFVDLSIHLFVSFDGLSTCFNVCVPSVHLSVLYKALYSVLWPVWPLKMSIWSLIWFKYVILLKIVFLRGHFPLPSMELSQHNVYRNCVPNGQIGIDREETQPRLYSEGIKHIFAG